MNRIPDIGPARIAVLSLYRGGMLHVAAGLANSVAAADAAARIACFGPAEMNAALFHPRVERWPYPLPELITAADAVRWMRLPATAARLRAELLAWRPSLIHCNSGHWLHPWLVPALARACPLVATLHDVRPHPGERRPHHGWKLATLLRHASRILVHSEEMRRQAIETWGLPAGRVVALPLVGFSHCVRADTNAGGAAHPADLLLYGRVYAYKGYDVFFRAWPSIVARVPGARVTIAGAGDLAPWRDAIAAAGRAVRVINRFVDDEETARLFAETALVVLPYTEASQSGVARLAAAYGRAVVASRVGAIPEAVRDGESGLLVPPGDPAALADAVVALLRDRPRREAMGNFARAWTTAEFGPVAIGKQLVKLYHAVLAEPRMANECQS